VANSSASSVRTLSRELTAPRHVSHRAVGDVVVQGVDEALLTLEQASSVLDVATWSGADNGAALQRTLNLWLSRGEDLTRVWLALYHHVFPTKTKSETTAALEHIVKKFPELRQPSSLSRPDAVNYAG
jgi:hypothetical protein